MQPFRIDLDGVPLFTNNQIDDYGFPEHWGYEIYRIVENRDSVIMTTDFKLEQSYYKRPIHRYCRRKRFMTTLHKLLGDKGKVPEHIIQIIQTYIQPGDLWNQIRAMLKHFKCSIYYNRIPYIINRMTRVNSVPPVSVDQYREMAAEFDRFCYWFDQNKHQFDRTYFPNMRFIALKLIQAQGIELNYPIPFARTKRKLKQLEFIWNLFINKD